MPYTIKDAFSWQACQGTRSMLSVSPEADLDMDGGSCPRGVYPTPVKADFLLAYATVPGHVSYRSREEGSYFIQVIVSIFEKNYERYLRIYCFERIRVT